MLEPTVSNLYYLMKDMLVKPSIYKEVIYTERAFHMGFTYRTILNEHKDFTITQRYSNQFTIDITKYKYSIWIPSTLNCNRYKIKKYA